MNWLKKIIGPSLKDVWSEQAAEMGAQFIDGGLWGTPKISYRHKGRDIVMDTYSSGGQDSSRYTRLQCDFVSLDQFTFRIYEENILSSWSKAIGLQDIQVGDTQFDDKYMLKSNDEEKLKLFFQSINLKDAFNTIEKVRLKIGPLSVLFSQKTNKKHQVYLEQVGRLQDKKKITALFTLFCLILDRLELTQSIEEK